MRIDGSASRDPEGGALTYRWTGPFPQGDGVLSGPAGDVTLPLGTHQLTLRVTDPQGASAEASQLVTVRDTTAPVVVAPATLTVQATGAGTAVGLAPPAARDVSPLTFRSNAPPLFPLGDTVVTWTITDAAGNAAVARHGRVTAREGEFVVRAGCADTCTLDVSATALLNGIPVRDGQRVRLELAHRTEVHREHGRLHELEAPAFTLEVTCRDASANTSHASATPAFQDPRPPHRRPGHPPHRGDRAAGRDDDHPAPPHVHARR